MGIKSIVPEGGGGNKTERKSAREYALQVGFSFDSQYNYN
jgi:hypothetical protein